MPTSVESKVNPWPLPTAGDVAAYLVDAWQRAILTWDVLRERGNQYLEHERQSKPPVLVFKHEMVLDGRNLPKPANYALLRIIPGADDPATDPKKRPFVVIDPRAGHGPGIGGFKIDSEIGIALQQGHPCYFVMFFPQPVPGQTIESTVNLVLTKDGLLALNGQPSTFEAAGAFIRAEVARAPKLQAVIAADKTVSYGQVMTLVDLVKRNGVTAFALDVERGSEVPAGAVE